MNEEQLARYADAGYNRVAITRRVLADLDTPLSAYLKLAAGPYSYLLESVEGGEKWGRYSIIGLPARTVIEIRGETVNIKLNGVVVESATAPDPYATIRAYLARYRVAEDPEMARFGGGLVGYFGYDTVRYVEPKLRLGAPPDTLATPDVLLMLSDEFLVFDNLKGEIQFVCYVDPSAAGALNGATARLAELSQLLEQPAPPTAARTAVTDPPEPVFSSEFGNDAFIESVEHIKRYILDGDVMQVVLAQRMSTPIEAPPIDVYRALRHLNPSPYLYYMNLDEFHIVGSSPEILVRLEGDTITTRPLAGTRPRGATTAEDQALERELLADPKELAEHLMLIDLGRNDVGRVAATGTVEVTEKMVIERYSNVMHISSSIEGKIAPGLDAIDVLRSCLPVGTLSGAPKIRAMEIIDELEPTKRGVYGGAVGYISWNGNMDTAIAIRTAVIKNGELFIQAGCGVVADSAAELEWEETLNKGRAMFRAVALAERGLRYTAEQSTA